MIVAQSDSTVIGVGDEEDGIAVFFKVIFSIQKGCGWLSCTTSCIMHAKWIFGGITGFGGGFLYTDQPTRLGKKIKVKLRPPGGLEGR